MKKTVCICFSPMCSELLANRPINLFRWTATLGSPSLSPPLGLSENTTPQSFRLAQPPRPSRGFFLLVLMAWTALGFTSVWPGASQTWLTQVRTPDITPAVDGGENNWVLSSVRKQLRPLSFFHISMQMAAPFLLISVQKDLQVWILLWL